MTTNTGRPITNSATHLSSGYRLLLTIGLTGFLLISLNSAPPLARASLPAGSAEANSLPVATPDPGRPLALIDGRPITQDDLLPEMLEAAGGQVLFEATLDRRLEQQLKDAKLTLPPEALQREKDLLIASMTRASDADTGARVLADVQAERGLGPLRFAKLIRRNALLRALVKDQVVINNELIGAAYAAVHGPRVVFRLITVADDRKAAAVAAQLADVEPSRIAERFAELAISRSTDRSASNGGLIGPVSQADPSLPERLRTMLMGLAPGETSKPFALDNSVAIVHVSERSKGDGRQLEECRAELESLVRARQERLLMEKLARATVGAPGVTVMDTGLQWSVGASGTGLR